jgi:hypothetical protein
MESEVIMSTAPKIGSHLEPSPFVHFESYRQRAARMRGEYVGQSARHGLSRVARGMRPSRSVGLSFAALALATVAFWAVMLTSPPTTVAEVAPGISIESVHRNAPRDLPALYVNEPF